MPVCAAAYGRGAGNGFGALPVDGGLADGGCTPVGTADGGEDNEGCTDGGVVLGGDGILGSVVGGDTFGASGALNFDTSGSGRLGSVNFPSRSAFTSVRFTITRHENVPLAP